MNVNFKFKFIVYFSRYIAEGQCCSECTDCFYESQFRRNNEEFSSADSCSTCRCTSGSVRCRQRTCPNTGCRLEETLDGECCPVCRGCVDRTGRRYDHGERFIPPYDVCSECACTEGSLSCSTIRCTEVCSHPVINPTECCPSCDSCQDRTTTYANGDPVQSPEPCRTCRCSRGSIICDPVPCPPVLCPNPVQMPGQCCPECRQCVYEGSTYQNNEQWVSRTDPCQQCTCQVSLVVISNRANSLDILANIDIYGGQGRGGISFVLKTLGRERDTLTPHMEIFIGFWERKHFRIRVRVTESQSLIYKYR